MNIRTYGQQPTAAPEHCFAPIEFPQLAMLDVGTREGMLSRVLSANGANTRALPRTISYQYVDDEKHLRSVPVGALHELTVNGDTGVLSGKGWLVDTPDGRMAALTIRSHALKHNSIDLADIPHDGMRLIEHGDWWDDDFWVEVVFDSWSFSKTTIVANPAHRDAYAALPEAAEIMASLEGGALIVDCPSFFTANSPVEITASAAGLPSWDYFHRAEADIPHKLIVATPDDNGWIPVYGHLGRWDVPHSGYDGQQIYIPRPRDNYRSFNRPGPLTDRGQVEAGPIVLFGGHISLKAAADDPKNAWADVRAVAGKHGPWLSGVVRPRVSADDAAVYVARASQLSGHWKGDKLRMIISCNSEGFHIDGWDIDEPLGADELVASFNPEADGRVMSGLPTELLSFTELTSDAQEKILDWVRAGRERPEVTASSETDPDPSIEIERARRERELALELEDA